MTCYVPLRGTFTFNGLSSLKAEDFHATHLLILQGQRRWLILEIYFPVDVADGYAAWLAALITFHLYSTSIPYISVNKLKTLAWMLAKRNFVPQVMLKVLNWTQKEQNRPYSFFLISFQSEERSQHTHLNSVSWLRGVLIPRSPTHLSGAEYTQGGCI